LKAFRVKELFHRFTERNPVFLDIRKFLGGIPRKLHAVNLLHSTHRHHPQVHFERMAIYFPMRY